MLKVVVGNRMEDLALHLADRLAADPLSDPLARERVLIPSRGMETWLATRIASVVGVSACIDFAFPARSVRKVLAAALAVADGVAAGAPDDPDGDAADPWDPDRIAWALLHEIPARLEDPRFAALAGYLAGRADDEAPGQDGQEGMAPGGAIGRREYGVARRIADLFDEYAKYRPDWVRAWSAPDATERAADLPGAGPDFAWQPLLWAAVSRRLGCVHPLARLAEARAVLADPGRDVPGLPSRLTVFGISTMPPVFLDVLDALSRRIDVTVYALSPVEGYFGHVKTRAEKARLRQRTPDADPDDLHLADPPLVESLGRLGRDFNEILAGMDAIDLVEAYREPDGGAAGTTSMLAGLQSDLLALRDAGGPLSGVPAHAIDRPDGTIAFHACHGALRQVEVLRDVLLGLFRDHPDLQPRDVVVMCPDIDAFAPLIDAVFSEGDTGHPAEDDAAAAGFPRARFSIADRNARGLNPVAEALSRVLELATGRVPASGLLDLLDLDPVRRRFGLDADGMQRVRTWVIEGRARWGLDEGHRQDEGQPGDRQNTWRFALDRLVLGAAMAGDDGRSFAGVLPFDGVEGEAARDLGCFLRFCSTLFEARRRLTDGVRGRVHPGAVSRSLADWRSMVGDLLDAFVDVPGSAFWQVRKVREAATALTAEAAIVGLDRPVDLDTYRRLLDDRLASGGSTAGLLKGGINFCALVPMRSIPFRVVCLLGMDDGAFPRQVRRPGFDLLARDRPRPGDRSARDDDRYLFLEALLSARDAVVVLWNGRGIRDNVELPPAVPVGELLDAVARSFVVPGHSFDDLRAALVRVHPLQAFSPQTFRSGGDAPRGFDRRDARAARALQGDKGGPWTFFDGDVLPRPAAQVVRVDDLASFFEHPAKYLLRRRLGVVLDAAGDAVEDREPLGIDALEDWAAGDELLRSLLRGEPVEAARERIRMQGGLPLGAPGDRLLDGLAGRAAEVYEDFRSLDLGDPSPQSIPSTAFDGGVRFEGGLDGVREGGLVAVHYGRNRPRRVLAAWVRHVAACAFVPGFSGRTYVVGRAGASSGLASIVRFEGLPPGDGTLADRARALLDRLLALYGTGGCQPLLLFPDSGWQYADAFRSARDPANADAEARGRAMKAFAGNPGTGAPGEAADPYWAFVLRGLQPWRRGADLRLPGMTDALRPDVLARSVMDPILATLAAEGAAEVTP